MIRKVIEIYPWIALILNIIFAEYVSRSEKFRKNAIKVSGTGESTAGNEYDDVFGHVLFMMIISACLCAYILCAFGTAHTEIDKIGLEVARRISFIMTFMMMLFYAGWSVHHSIVRTLKFALSISRKYFFAFVIEIPVFVIAFYGMMLFFGSPA